jgi:hypothetical protein
MPAPARYTIAQASRMLSIMDVTILKYIRNTGVLPLREDEQGELYLLHEDLLLYRAQHQGEPYRRGKAKLPLAAWGRLEEQSHQPIGDTPMEKIPTLFLRNPNNMKLVTREINPDAAWALTADVIPTIKKDGTNVRVTVLAGKCIGLEKRRNPTREEKATGAEPGYVLASVDDPADKHIIAAVAATDFRTWPDGAWPCEALGPKIQGGIESSTPCLYPFSWSPEPIPYTIPLIHDDIAAYLMWNPIEGIVWHEQGGLGRMAKIKRRDFDLSWPIKSTPGTFTVRG